MSTLYPAAVDDSSTLPNPSAGSATNSPSHAGLHDNTNDAVKAVEAKLGTGAATPVASRFLTGIGTGSSDWSRVVPTGVVVGTTDAQTLTNKTLTSPTINGGTIDNATVTVDAIAGHTTAGSGTIYGLGVAAGALTGPNVVPTAAIQAGAVNYAKLLSTIFSGQLLTQANAGSAGGTMNYLNLGGIKLLWMNTTGATGATTYTVVFPTSFFTTVTAVLTGYIGSSGTTGGQYIVTGSTGPTGFQWYSGANPQTGYFFVIGT